MWYFGTLATFVDIDIIPEISYNMGYIVPALSLILATYVISIYKFEISTKSFGYLCNKYL